MIVLAVIVVVAVIGGIWFVASRRGSGQVPPEVSAHKPTSADDVLPAPPSEQKEGAGEAEESEGAQAPQAPTLERPESIPGRMQRLRARLAGSGGFGRAVLSVLSRGDLNEGTYLELDDDLTVDGLTKRVLKKRESYKELIGGYVAVRDKLSHERLLNYLESKIPEIDNLGVLLLHDDYVSRRFFDWLVESDATIPLLFAFKNTGDVVYTKNTKLTSDKLLKEVFKDGSEPLEVSIDKLKYMAKFKAPKKQLADKNKSLSDMFMDAVRKVDGTNAE